MALRKLSISPGSPRTRAEKQQAAQERYFVNSVKNHPKYKMIIAHLAQGALPADIAAHFAEQGWITMNERSFTECLRYYRRVCAKDIEQVQREGLDAIVDPNQPQRDVLKHLHHLLGVQMERISIDVRTEQSIAKLFNTTSKEIEVANKLIESIAKIEGRYHDGSARSRKQTEEVAHDVHENLSGLKKDEGTRNRLHNLTRDLVKAQK